MFGKRKKKYRVLIEGSNLLMDVKGVRRLGYFTTRYVEGLDCEEAVECALDLVQNELSSTGALLNAIGDPPGIATSEVVQIDSFKGVGVPGKGFTFFPEDEEQSSKGPGSN